MKEQLKALALEAEQELAQVTTLEEINELKVRFLGKKGLLTGILRGMGQLSAEERPLIGQLANEVRESLEVALESKLSEIKVALKDKQLREENIDVTLPGTPLKVGKKHPLTRVLDEAKSIFLGMGFEVVEGPEVETDYYNFEALNLPKDHPARDMQDSFYITEETLLRTHTSNLQPRTMEKKAPQIPIKVIAPGKVYRRDDDATHSPMFNQIEGFVIEKQINMGDLKGTLLSFAKEMFGEDREIRLRPSFFPFTEPSVEVDVSCVMCNGTGCRVCSETGWLEILGAGMIHPRVLEMSGYDPKEVTGFAFGMGVERITMLKYGIDDLRLLFENDQRFLKQF